MCTSEWEKYFFEVWFVPQRSELQLSLSYFISLPPNKATLAYSVHTSQSALLVCVQEMLDAETAEKLKMSGSSRVGKLGVASQKG